jgi:hypothetical protein
MSDFQSWVSDLSKEPGFAGMLGSLLSLRWMPGMSWKQKAFSLAGGFAVAWYLVPFALESLTITSKSAPTAFGFLGGFIGLNLLGKMWTYVAETTFGELLSKFWSKSP